MYCVVTNEWIVLHNNLNPNSMFLNFITLDLINLWTSALHSEQIVHPFKFLKPDEATNGPTLMIRFLEVG